MFHSLYLLSPSSLFLHLLLSSSFLSSSNIRQSKITSLNQGSPPDRTQTDSALISWNHGVTHGVVLFGGLNGGLDSGKILDDLWRYTIDSDGTSWIHVPNWLVPGPSKRYGHTLTNVGFDSSFVVLFGGANATLPYDSTYAGVTGDTWLLTADNQFGPVRWSQPLLEEDILHVTGAKTTKPSARYLHAMASMAPKGKNTNSTKTISAVMFGGCSDLNCDTLLDDAWIFSGERYYDPSSGNVIFKAAQWNLITPPKTNTKPSARRSHAMSYLGSAVGRILLFGGACGHGAGAKVDPCSDTDGTGTGNGITWELQECSIVDPCSDNDGTGIGNEKEYQWVQISKSKMSSNVEWPLPRHCSSMAALTDGSTTEENGFTALVLGGVDGTGNQNNVFKSTWTYGALPGNNYRTWKQHLPAATPAKRAMTTMAHLPGTENAILFGGSLAVQGKNNNDCKNSLDGMSLYCFFLNLSFQNSTE